MHSTLTCHTMELHLSNSFAFTVSIWTQICASWRCPCQARENTSSSMVISMDLLEHGVSLRWLTLCWVPLIWEVLQLTLHCPRNLVGLTGKGKKERLRNGQEKGGIRTTRNKNANQLWCWLQSRFKSSSGSERVLWCRYFWFPVSCTTISVVCCPMHWYMPLSLKQNCNQQCHRCEQGRVPQVLLLACQSIY